jgi:hypothetical protein
MRNAVIVVILAAAGMPALALHRCVDAAGKVSLQDRPCEPTQTQSTIRVPVPVPPTPASRTSAPERREVERFKMNEAMEKAKVERDMRVNDAILRREVVVGMSADELRRAQGDPVKVNSDSYDTPEQWVFHDGQFAKYVYVHRGMVRSFQRR